MTPRLMDVRFCFQAAQNAAGEQGQFFVRVAKVDGQLRLTVDIGGADDGLVEGLEPAFLDAVQAALAVVGRVKLPELAEQSE